DTPANGADIRAHFFNADGTPAGGDFVVSTTTAGDQSAAVIGVSINNTLSILWQTPDTVVPGRLELVERSFDLAGNPISAERQVTDSGINGSYSATQRSDGTIILVYDNAGDIYGRLLDANWSPLNAEVRLNTTITGTQNAARLTGLTNGNIIVGFQSN